MDIKEATELEKEHVFPTYRRFPVLFTDGRGVYVRDDSGKRYLDFLTGLAVNALGHRNRRVNDAIRKQLLKLSHVSNLYYTEPMLLLAKRLCDLSGMKKVFFSNSGAEANEAAIKIVRRYHKEILEDGRGEIICFRNSFHGRTLGTLAATGTDMYKTPFEPLPAGFLHAEFNNLESVEALISDKTAAIMLEPIQGEAGIYPATQKFMLGLAQLRDKHGLQLIFDEVQCGLGRTGRWFAFEHFGVKPDVMTLAKPLGGGLPLGAMLADGPVVEGFGPGNHATTFGAGPVPCAAALAVLDEIDEAGLLANVNRMGNHIVRRLEKMRETQPRIKDIRGKGLMLAVEIDADAPAAMRFMMENGLLVNAVRANTIRILPPFIITEKHADVFLGILGKFLETADATGVQ